MQPPFPVTGDSTVDWTIFGIGALVCLYWLRALRLAREGAKRLLRHLILAGCTFLSGIASLTALRPQTRLQAFQEQVIAGIAALILFACWQRSKRSRYIPRATRRAVIERDLQGRPFDPNKYHIDHVWPFSKGGSHTVDNLRIVPKKRNLRKGARRPRIREMF